ncbi:MAG TPA: MaoC family dehydratase N-terminal domain-containing protein [Actinocrinis sp.]|uniref:MaoC family dehydratase N-terminal domain-containing protein n=1 Tax=Actinocrinis sp. TaxID=1920516 RepID=UPI002DDD271F|nr:MaoC family dehydratase N-terminal domain-containing protein [Actinocrinis sp.]HEV2344130.1 MaoC family dehydratase N-terminal domain-containing protein [Actinocrinis sp.]
MPLDQSFVGRTYPPTETYEVARVKIREFAEAVGDLHPAYLDPEAAKALGHPDVIAPPTFSIVISMPAVNRVVDDPALGLDWSRVVHGDQSFSHTRPMRAGDHIQCSVRVESIRSMAGNDMITLACELSTVEGEPVCTSRAMLVARAEKAGDVAVGSHSADNRAGES